MARKLIREAQLGDPIDGHKCPACSSTEFRPVNGLLVEFYESCANCGVIVPTSSGRKESRTRRTLAAMVLRVQVLFWSALGGLLMAMGFLLFGAIGHIVLWAIWNAVIVNVLDVSRSNILEPPGHVWWFGASFLFSLGIVMMLIRYLPGRFLPSIFHDSRLRERRHGKSCGYKRTS
jgi:hypothetical protein